MYLIKINGFKCLQPLYSNVSCIKTLIHSTWNVWLYLWVADELPVKLGIERLHMQAIHIQHRITDNTDLRDKGEKIFHYINSHYCLLCVYLKE